MSGCCWPCWWFEEDGRDDPLALSSALASWPPFPSNLELLNLHKGEPKQDLEGSEDREVGDKESKDCFFNWFVVFKW